MRVDYFLSILLLTSLPMTVEHVMSPWKCHDTWKMVRRFLWKSDYILCDLAFYIRNIGIIIPFSKG